MTPEHARRLVCPKCRGPLRSIAFAEAENGAVQDGVLLCDACRLRYPVVNRVPVMLLFRTAVHAQFDRKHAAALAAWPDHRAPEDEPLPGERTTQETFTEEWDLIEVDGDDLSFTYTQEELVRLNRDVWLKWLPRSSEKIEHALVVGCGAGKELAALGQLLPECEIYATDINLSVVRVGGALGHQPHLHVTICSLFHLPFAEAAFDLVYSQGVLHHNRSTRAAFAAIAPFVRPRGYLFVWVYGLDDHLVKKGWTGLVARINYHVEMILRPALSVAPKFVREAFFFAAGVGLHALIKTRIRHRARWRLANTIHSLRDWLSPRYAHVHSYNEVLEWYEREAFDIVDVQAPGAYRDLFGKQLWGVGLTGQKREARPAPPPPRHP